MEYPTSSVRIQYTTVYVGISSFGSEIPPAAAQKNPPKKNSTTEPLAKIKVECE
jgi:hypothetical protein